MKNGRPATERIELGEHIVADPEICHGKPTFKGTRIMVWQVLDDVADGRSWDFICNQRWGGRIPLGAVAEAVKLAKQTTPLTNGDFSFNFETQSNQSYTVQQNTDLTTTNWTYFTNITGNGAPYQVIQPATNAVKNFFRVRQP